MRDASVLTISASVFATLDQRAEQVYLKRLMDQVAGLGMASGTQEEVLTRCGELVRSGRAAGFSTELELAAWVVCGFAAGSDFHQHQPYRRILDNSDLEASSKAEMLMMVLDHTESSESDDNEAGLGKEQDS
jgi:hypothetical protein